MGYRDDFYVAANLIGYTGEAHKMPTVYFQKGDEFGHITQFHDVPHNIGREGVGKHAQYSISNEKIEGQLKCVEKIGKEVFHESRNKFIGAGEIDQKQKDVLLQSISKFSEVKAVRKMSEKELQQVFKQVDQKEKMHAQMLKKVAKFK